MNTTIQFGGFYHSIHSYIIENSINSFIEYDNETNDTNKNEFDDYNLNYHDMQIQYINQYIPLLENHIKDNYNIDIKFSNVELYSPKYYNYYTDEIMADIDKPYTLIDTFKTNQGFLDYLKDYTKSSSGYYSNYKYEEALNNKNDILPVYILSYICEKWQESEDYCCNLADSIYIDVIDKNTINA